LSILFDFILPSDMATKKNLDATIYDMRQNICTLWSLIRYPHGNDVIAIVR